MADIRTLKVIGRINILIISITTIKNLIIIGHPKGTKWIIEFLKKNKNEFKKHEIHIIKLKKKKKFNWEFKQKENGSKLIKLINIIVKYILVNKFIDIFELLLKLDLIKIHVNKKIMKYLEFL